jgi:hypothetical protein
MKTLFSILLPLTFAAAAAADECPSDHRAAYYSQSSQTESADGTLRPKPNPRLRGKPHELDCKKAKSDDFVCLACNLYFEARGEGYLGMAAVAETTVGRFAKANDKRNSVCKIVHEPYQFSWTQDESKPIANLNSEESKAWDEAQAIAHLYMAFKGSDKFEVTNPKLHCYNYYMDWRLLLPPVKAPKEMQTIHQRSLNGPDISKPVCSGQHIFIRDPNDKCPGVVKSMAEGDDHVLMIRNNFYKKCLGYKKMPTELPANKTHEYPKEICGTLTLEEAASRQYEAYKDPTDINLIYLPTAPDEFFEEEAVK